MTDGPDSTSPSPSPASGFALDADTTVGGDVTTNAISQVLGVSSTTIRNWTLREGMPTAGKGPDGHDRYNVAKCREWVKANKAPGIVLDGVEQARGGVRRNSGRPKGAKTRRRAAEQAVSQPSQPTLADAAGGEDEDGGIGRALNRLRTQKEELNVKRLDFKFDLERGILLKRDECNAAWTRHTDVIKAGVDALAAAVTPDILSALRLDPSHGPAIQTILEKHVREFKAGIAADPLRTGVPSHEQAA